MKRRKTPEDRARKARSAASRKAGLRLPLLRAQTFRDRRREASRRACRGPVR